VSNSLKFSFLPQCDSHPNSFLTLYTHRAVGQDQLTRLKHKKPTFWIILACTSLLLLSISFLSGRSTIQPCSNNDDDHQGDDSGTDTTAPEGRLKLATFAALHDYRAHPRYLSTSTAMVAADHGRCSDIGLYILETLQGNAVDAAIATVLCQGIFNPMASGLGGGHFMLIRKSSSSSSSETEMIDAREMAPSLANETMFVGRPEASLRGGLAVAVPLELKGLQLAHDRHGRLEWKELIEPIIPLAREGFPAHPYLIASLEGVLEGKGADMELLKQTFLIKDKKSSNGGGRKGVGVGSNMGWRLPNLNETCCARPALATLLEQVAQHGADVLYQGEYSHKLVADIQKVGGIITVEDINNAQAVVRQPLRTRAFGVDFIGAAPPSSSVAVLLGLRILQGFELPLAGAASLGYHRVVEAMKHAFALRMNLGDPGTPPSTPEFLDFLDDLTEDVVSPTSNYPDQLRNMISDEGVLDNLESYGGVKWNAKRGGMSPVDHGTSHICVVDGERMAVSVTTTINTGFGSKIISPSTGLLLNNQMDDFSTPNQTNVYGIAPSPANFIRPGKRPLSSMSPLIAEVGGQLRAVLGASGGPRIVSAVLLTATRILARGEDAYLAAAAPRLHHQLYPPTVFAENWNVSGVSFEYSEELLGKLRGKGHDVASTDWGAVVQAIVVDDYMDGGANLHGVSDPRKDGAPAGY